MAFREVRVRQDLAQTDGDTVRPPARPTLLEGEAPAGLWDTLADKVRAEGFELVRADIPSGANGTTNYTIRTVAIAPHLSPAQAAKTLAHELAHVHLHDGTEYALGCRGRAEVEAESVAYSSAKPLGSPPPPTASATSPDGPQAIPASSRPPRNESLPPHETSSTAPASSSRPSSKPHDQSKPALEPSLATVVVLT